MKNAKQIWKSGKSDDITPMHVEHIINNLYLKGIAEVFFIGMGWPEGYTYCANPEYLRKTFAPTAMEKFRRQIWFACRFLD